MPCAFGIMACANAAPLRYMSWDLTFSRMPVFARQEHGTERAEWSHGSGGLAWLLPAWEQQA